MVGSSQQKKAAQQQQQAATQQQIAELEANQAALAQQQAALTQPVVSTGCGTSREQPGRTADPNPEAFSDEGPGITHRSGI